MGHTSVLRTFLDLLLHWDLSISLPLHSWIFCHQPKLPSPYPDVRFLILAEDLSPFPFLYLVGRSKRFYLRQNDFKLISDHCRQNLKVAGLDLPLCKHNELRWLNTVKQYHPSPLITLQDNFYPTRESRLRISKLSFYTRRILETRVQRS